MIGISSKPATELKEPQFSLRAETVTITFTPPAETETATVTTTIVSTEAVTEFAIATETTTKTKTATETVAALGTDDDIDPRVAAAAVRTLKPPQCEDPYKMPGYLQIPKGGKRKHHEARYVPYYDDLLELPQTKDAVDLEHATMLFDDEPVEDDVLKLAPINWLALLKEHVFYEKKKSDKQSARQTEVREQLEWLRNRRILMAADSIDRFMAQHFCTTVDEKFEIGPEGKHTTAWCHISSLNFTIYHWHIASMFSIRPTWWAMPQMTRVSFEDRIVNMYLKTLPDVNGPNGQAPDLILYQSNLWDVRGYAKADEFKQNISTPNTYLRRQMTWNELKFYMNRNQQFIEYLRNIFTRTVPMMMRTVIPHRDQGKTDISLYEIDRMARFVAYHAGNEVFEWGLSVPGFPEIYRDDMHVDIGAHSTMYGNMMLYYLFRSLGGAQVKGQVTRWPQDSNFTVEEAWAECHHYDFLQTR